MLHTLTHPKTLKFALKCNLVLVQSTYRLALSDREISLLLARGSPQLLPRCVDSEQSQHTKIT